MSADFPVRSRLFLAIGCSLVMVAGMLFGANIATADSVWVQSYERSSQTEACAAQPGETPWQASWGTDPSWSPSWEMWANNGNGGWVCTRSITWARTPIAASSGGGSVSYAVGDVGPGGGLVFLIANGLTYEMAPKTWGSAETTRVPWCNNATLDVPGATGTAVGDGSVNTAAIDAVCTSGAAQSAADYSANGLSDWFLPSKDEWYAMWSYSQVGGFNTATYGFETTRSYWSSSQSDTSKAWAYDVQLDGTNNASKANSYRVRPIRAF